MSEKSIVIAGLPGSGKTTFLAALWHILTAPEPLENNSLKLGKLTKGDYRHLNALVDCWREGKTQERTIKDEEVSMTLEDISGGATDITFPDLSGESFRDMWEDRSCSELLHSVLTRGSGLLLFVHADRVVNAPLTVDVAQDMKDAGVPLIPIPPGTETKWAAEHSPTQVSLTDLLQLFRRKPIRVKFDKLAIVLSAWDKIEDDNLSPEEFLAERLPLMDQYLRCNADNWNWKIYGVSAQGADYHPNSSSKEKLSPEQLAKLNALYDLEAASQRIKVISEGLSSDLTKPLAWLMQ